MFDSSLELKMIRKYAQAFLSGCVFASDVPSEHEEDIGELVIQLDSSMTFPDIEAVIKTYLDRPALLEEMAIKAYAWARHHFTNARKIEGVVRLSDEYRKGRRGYSCKFRPLT